MAQSFEEQQKKYKNFLMPGEEMCFVLRPHWRFIIVGLVIGAGVIAGWIGWSYVWERWLGVNATIPRNIGTLIALVLLLIFTARPILEWLVTRYYFTTNRVSTKEGLLSKRRGDVPLDEMANIYYEQGVLDRLLRCGTIQIDSSGGRGFAIDNVPDVERVTRDIHILMEGGIPPDRMHGADGSPINNSREKKPPAAVPPEYDHSDEETSYRGKGTTPMPASAGPRLSRPSGGSSHKSGVKITLIQFDFAADAWDDSLTRRLKTQLRVLPRNYEYGQTSNRDDGRLLEGEAELAGTVWFVTLTDNEGSEYELDLRNRTGVNVKVADDTEQIVLDALYECGVDDDDILNVDRKIKKGAG